MSGYKRLVLDHAQAIQWKDSLCTHGIEVESEGLFEPEDENVRVKENPISIKLGVRELSAIEYFNKATGEKGIVFLHKNPEDIELIDMIIALLK